MQAAILAGGLGTRLRPLTERIPKVMVSVNGQPFLWHLLQLLKSQGVNDIVLCTGYLGHQIKVFFGNGQSLGVRIRYSEEPDELLGTGGALKQAQSLLDDSFFVVNGDTYLPLDYGEVLRTLIRCGKKAVMVVYNNQEDTGVENNVELNDELMVVRHDKARHNQGLKYVEAGVLTLRQEALNLLQERHPVSLEKGLYPGLIQQRELVACIARQRFYDIGTRQQLRTFEKYLKERSK